MIMPRPIVSLVAYPVSKGRVCRALRIRRGSRRHGALRTAAIQSVAGRLPERGGLSAMPPFVAPHHSSSMAALIGGDSSLARPGAVSLAHSGGLPRESKAPKFRGRASRWSDGATSATAASAHRDTCRRRPSGSARPIRAHPLAPVQPEHDRARARAHDTYRPGFPRASEERRALLDVFHALLDRQRRQDADLVPLMEPHLDQEPVHVLCAI
jgi:hypothetical protein